MYDELVPDDSSARTYEYSIALFLYRNIREIHAEHESVEAVIAHDNVAATAEHKERERSALRELERLFHFLY
jgi:hypothetical protein